MVPFCHLVRRPVGLVLALAAAMALTGCFGVAAQPPTTGPEPGPGLPSGPVTAAWTQSPANLTATSGDPTPLVALDATGRAHVLPAVLDDRCEAFPRLALSPDGRKAAVWIGGCGPMGQAGRTSVVLLATGAVLGTVEGGFGGVAWSPDSGRLVVTGGAPSRPSVIVDVTGVVLAQLPAGLQPLWAPSPLVALESYAADEQRVVLEPDGRPSAHPAAGPGRTRATPCGSLPVIPDGEVSPDDKLAVDLPNAGPDQYLAVCRVSTGRLRRLSPDYAPVDLEGGHGWLPDGRLVVMIGQTIQEIDVHTGHHRTLAHPPANRLYSGLVTPRRPAS